MNKYVKLIEDQIETFITILGLLTFSLFLSDSFGFVDLSEFAEEHIASVEVVEEVCKPTYHKPIAECGKY